MVGLKALFLRGPAAAEFLVGEHGLADVDAPVVDEVHGPDLGSGGPQNTGDAFSEGVVPEVAEMERFVRVRARKFHHDFLARQGRAPAVSFPLRVEARAGVGDEGRPGEKDVEVGTGRRDGSGLGGPGVLFEQSLQLRTDFRRSGTEKFGEIEERDREIPEVGPRRCLDDDIFLFHEISGQSFFLSEPNEAGEEEVFPEILVILHDVSFSFQTGRPSSR